MRIDADLVTLSACETALGQELAGEGIVGLTRAFHYAGARTVLASLWNVTDRSTAELMKRFYGGLKEGLPKDEALRAAQIDLIRGSIRATEQDDEERGVKKLAKSEDEAAVGRYASPYYWAAFELFGDWC
jgi:CHAT domain-containing protein